MAALGNILWHFPFLGFVNAIFTYLFGLLLTITVVAAPIGLGLMEYGKFLFAPFSHAMVSKSELGVRQNKLWQTYSTIVTILYIPFGIISSVIAALQVAGLFLNPSSTVVNLKLPFKGHYSAWEEVLAPRSSFTSRTDGGIATPAPCNTLPHTPLSGVRSRYRFP